jgi:hypothetical protein
MCRALSVIVLGLVSVAANAASPQHGPAEDQFQIVPVRPLQQFANNAYSQSSLWNTFPFNRYSPALGMYSPAYSYGQGLAGTASSPAFWSPSYGYNYTNSYWNWNTGWNYGWNNNSSGWNGNWANANGSWNSWNGYWSSSNGAWNGWNGSWNNGWNNNANNYIPANQTNTQNTSTPGWNYNSIAYQQNSLRPTPVPSATTPVTGMIHGYNPALPASRPLPVTNYTYTPPVQSYVPAQTYTPPASYNNGNFPSNPRR